MKAFLNIVFLIRVFLLCIAVVSPRVATSTTQCYWPDGSEAVGHVPCQPNDVASPCCVSTDYCMDNGFCWSNNVAYYSRQSCTDSHWGSACLQQCLASSSGNSTYQNVIPCDTADGQWCCQYEGNCCGDDAMLAQIPGHVLGVAVSASNGGVVTTSSPTANTTVQVTATCSAPASASASSSILGSDTGRTCNQTIIGAAVGATLGAALLAALALFATERRRRIRAENSLGSVHNPPLPGTVMTEAPASYSQTGKQSRYHPAAPHEMDPHGELYEADSQTTVGNTTNVHNGWR